MEDKKAQKAPHVLVLSFPAQGHINPMLQFCKRLVSNGIKATLASSVYISKSMLADPNSPINIDTFSDGFDEGGYTQAESTDVYLKNLRIIGSQTLSNLIKKLNESGQRVHALIYNGFLPWALDVAKEFGLPGVVFFTQSCVVNNIYYQLHQGLISLPLSESSVLSIPGLPVLES